MTVVAYFHHYSLKYSKMSEVKGTKALELWCKRLIKDCPNVQIDNMTTSWRNGIAFCALVHHFRPDLIDLSTLKPENIYENNQQAFSIAEKHLGIPALLDPEDMVENEVPDRLSILTYLSQFYQRLGHTVNTKASENESKTPEPPSTSTAAAPFKFGKAALDKCAACGLPVYLAQRLIVSHKLYHRRCFRCSKCSGHLNPKNFQVIEGSEFCCDSCKNEKTMPRFLNNNDQIGMLAFNDDLTKTSTELHSEEPIVPKHKTRPQSILDKINMFEKQSEKEVNLEDKLANISLSDNIDSKTVESSSNVLNTTSKSQSETTAENMESALDNDDTKESADLFKQSPEKVYKSNIDKFNFLQTQLAEDAKDDNIYSDGDNELKHENFNAINTLDEISDSGFKEKFDSSDSVRKDESNMTDDIRIAKSHINLPPDIECPPTESNDSSIIEPQIYISVPPRKKKNLTQSGKSSVLKKLDSEKKVETKLYPDHLNPFSDDEEEEDGNKEKPKAVNTNPFGSSDEEDDDVPPIHPPPRLPGEQTSTPAKRLISANPFWSDGEEPSSDDEPHNGSANMYKSPLTTSTPNLPSGRRKKVKAPPPPVLVTAPATSMDDVASISSLSSYTSTVHSDQKSYGMATPRLKKKRLAPTPPDGMSVSGCGSLENPVDHSDLRNLSDAGRRKGPAPGLPLPERREVKMQMSPEELQVQLDMLETQQLGLERQGVLIEQMIRDKCEGEDAVPAPQEEVEDLVIQLCELVNEKNDLFRKQTELMYIRRQQRLEQEQADIEHEIRVIQSRPAVNRIDADKAREEQLVSRLVQIVRMRDELVQQIDAERRRERQEDLAIACSIATKRAQRNSDSNSSSMKSTEVVPAPKKNKVKDKVKKQLKKAKHSLISKKKEDSDKKEAKTEKEKKSK